MGIGPALAHNPTSRSPMQNGFHLPPPAPAVPSTTQSTARRGSAFDTKTLPPTPTPGSSTKTAKTAPPPPPSKSLSVQPPTSKLQIPVNDGAFHRSTSAPSIQPSMTLPRSTRPLPEPPTVNAHGSFSRPQFRLPTPTLPMATAATSPGIQPPPPARFQPPTQQSSFSSKFQVPSSPARAPGVIATPPPVPPPVQRPSAAPRPSHPPGPPAAQPQFRPSVAIGNPRGQPPAIPPPRNPRPSIATSASPSLPPPRLPSGPAPPLPPPRMASRPR